MSTANNSSKNMDWEEARSEFFQETYPSDRSVCESTANASIRSSRGGQHPPSLGQYRDVSIGTLESRSSRLSRQSTQVASAAKNPTASTTPADAVSPSGHSASDCSPPNAIAGPMLEEQVNEAVPHHHPIPNPRNTKARMKAAVQGLEEDDESDEGEIEVVDFTDENLATEVESWNNIQKLRDMPISLSEKRKKLEQYEKCPKIKLTKAMTLKFACLRLGHALRSLRSSICAILQSWSKPLICIDRHRGSEMFTTLGLHKVTIFILCLVTLTLLSFLLLPYLVFICHLSLDCQRGKEEDIVVREANQTLDDDFKRRFWWEKSFPTIPFYYSYLSPRNELKEQSEDVFVLSYLFNEYLSSVYLLVMICCHLGIAIYFFRGLVQLIKGVTSEETNDSWFKAIFSSWNHNMVCKTSSMLKHRSIYKQIKHKIYTSRSATRAKTFCTRCLVVGARVLALLLTLGFWVGIISGTHFITLHQTMGYHELGLLPTTWATWKEDPRIEKLMDVLIYLSPALFVAFVKVLTLPLALLLDQWEYFPFNSRVIAYSLRLFVSRLAAIFTLVTTIFHMESSHKLAGEPCWEDHLCRQLIAVAVTDLATDVILTLALRFPRVLLASLFKRQWSCSTKLNYDPYETIVDLVLDLSLVSLGSLYCPLLPLVMCLKLMIGYGLRLFHIWVNCSASRETHSPSCIRFLFIGFSSVMVLFSTLIFIYAILCNPVSSPCGPFKSGSMSMALTFLWTQTGGKPQNESAILPYHPITAYVLTSLIAVLLFGLYISHLKRLSIEKSANELKCQLALATQEKCYLISKIKRPTTSSTNTRNAQQI